MSKSTLLTHDVAFFSFFQGLKSFESDYEDMIAAKSDKLKAQKQLKDYKQ